MTPFAASSSSPVDDSQAASDQITDMLDNPDAAMETSGEPGLNIPADLAESAGLTDLAPGDSFTVTIKGTIVGNDPATGVRADITSASGGMKEEGMDMGAMPEDEGFTPPASKIELGPSKDFGA